DALDRGDHLINRSRGFTDAGSLGLSVLHHILHVDTHLVHGAGDFVDGSRGLHVDLGRLVGGAGDLVGAACDLRGAIANTAYKRTQPVRHLNEGVGQSVAAGAWLNLDGKITAGYSLRNSGHFFEIDDHAVEGAGQFSQLVVAVYVDGLIKIAGFPNLSCDADQRFQRLSNG